MYVCVYLYLCVCVCMCMCMHKSVFVCLFDVTRNFSVAVSKMSFQESYESFSVFIHTHEGNVFVCL